MAWGARLGLKHQINPAIQAAIGRLNGLGSPFGFETLRCGPSPSNLYQAKWPGEPVWV